jgi:hypothetical protein
MKDTLEKQLELLNYKKNEETKANPEQASYSFIGNMFREKKAAFDKKEYAAFLAHQAEEQRNNKLQQRFMSEEEYRLNANQLNVHPNLFRKPSAAGTPTISTTTGRWARSETGSASTASTPSTTKTRK